jgi:hypothetical protein
MGSTRVCIATLVLALAGAAPATADVIYNNLTPNGAMAIASRPDSAGGIEIEAADDFFTTGASITSASFVGMMVPGAAGTPTVSQIVVEIYRVFPNDSDVGRTSGPPLFSTAAVPTRVNSPSDVAFDSRDSAASDLAFSTTVLNFTFTASNSIQPGGIHPEPGQTTGGNGPLTGEEVQFDAAVFRYLLQLFFARVSQMNPGTRAKFAAGLELSVFRFKKLNHGQAPPFLKCSP